MPKVVFDYEGQQYTLQFALEKTNKCDVEATIQE